VTAVKLTSYDVARMIELSAVQAAHSEADVRALVSSAQEHRCIVVYPLSSWVPLARELLAGDPDIIIGGAVGFPSGGVTTSIKEAEARELVAMGCGELDVVINIGKLISDRDDEVLEDLRAVVNAADGLPVKVILECHYLTDDKIRTGCDLSIEAGARYVKTGTGWAPTGATLENIALIRQHVGEAILIKASGGVRGLETLLEMYRRGATRFGVRLDVGARIIEDIAAMPGGEVEVAPLWRSSRVDIV
jgi:deoxyribose-phosphate aldolase